MNRALPIAQQALRLSFPDGAMIRHSYPKRNAVKVGKFDKNKCVIVCNGVEFTSLSTFAETHKFEHAGRVIKTNGWGECEYYTEADGWKSTYNVRPLPK
jgi:hypothetical protein